MMNQVTLVGRLVKTPELFVAENGNKGSFITLAVVRPFKNQDGEYSTDFIDCTLWTHLAENTAEYCKTGDVIGVRGRIQTRIVDNEDGTKIKRTEVIAERVSFLASNDKGLKNEDINDVSIDEDNDNASNIEIKDDKKKKNSKKNDD